MWIVTSVLGSEAEPLREEADECFRRGGLETVDGIWSGGVGLLRILRVLYRMVRHEVCPCVLSSLSYSDRW